VAQKIILVESTQEGVKAFDDRPDGGAEAGNRIAPGRYRLA
jgi:hypothetical protein